MTERRITGARASATIGVNAIDPVAVNRAARWSTEIRVATEAHRWKGPRDIAPMVGRL